VAQLYKREREREKERERERERKKEREKKRVLRKAFHVRPGAGGRTMGAYLRT
jgi:hypothetical protein